MLTEQRKAELLQKIQSDQDVFYESIIKKDFEELEFLVNNRANVNARDAFGDTPLHDASVVGILDIVKFLVEKGANINAKNDEGETPLLNASIRGYFNIVQFLVEKGADVNAKNDEGKTPLLNASFYGYFNIVQFLVEKGADVNAKDNYNETAFLNACAGGSFEIVKFLVEKGANLYMKYNNGLTCLDVAREKNDIHIVNFLTPLMQPRAQVIVDTPLLSRETYSADEEGTRKYYENIEKFRKRLECPVCLTNERKIRLDCGHMLCNSCSARVDKCPECRTPITTRNTVYYNKYLKYKNKYLSLKKML